MPNPNDEKIVSKATEAISERASEGGDTSAATQTRSSLVPTSIPDDEFDVAKLVESRLRQAACDEATTHKWECTDNGPLRPGSRAKEQRSGNEKQWRRRDRWP